MEAVEGMRFESPWALLLLLALPLVAWVRRHRRGRGTVRFSSTEHAARSGCSWRQRLLGVPFAARLAALALLAVALARPQEGREQVRETSRGVAIEMVVDRSGSMGAEMDYGGERLSRLEVVKRVFEEFVTGKGRRLPGRPNDLIGMVAFARYADTICPLTLSHGALSRFLERIDLVKRRSEDGTAIGDAIALAAARLRTAEEALARQLGEARNRYEIKSKVIILLTDGEHNAGKRSPLEAAKLAKEWGIKVYAIGVGGGESVATIRGILGDFKVPIGGGVDMATLEAVAKETGGIARLAEDAEALRAVYREIDQLEKSEFESVRFLDYRERFPSFALAALAFLVAEVVLSCTVFRRIP